MKILGIETSCDETALSVIEAEGGLENPKFNILNTVLYSQVETHRPYGGVFPSLAKREHARNLVPLLRSLLTEEEGNTFSDEQIKQLKEIFEREPELLEHFLKHVPNIKKPDVDVIAVTYGPGLEPALWVGINFARALSYIWQIPVIPTNHMEGHIVSVLRDNSSDNVTFPVISLLISGGHTEIVLVKKWGEYEVLGKTLDDAVGEAFDKTARLIGLPYPGGPEISKLAEIARENNLSDENISLPRPMINSGDYSFSFSGIKTAALYLVKRLKEEAGGELSDETKQMVAREFEDAVTEVLLKKVLKAMEEYHSDFLIIGGGVVANKHIRKEFKKLEEKGITVAVPEMDLATDNAVMIAMAGYFTSLREEAEIFPEITANGNLDF